MGVARHTVGNRPGHPAGQRALEAADTGPARRAGRPSPRAGGWPRRRLLGVSLSLLVGRFTVGASSADEPAPATGAQPAAPAAPTVVEIKTSMGTIRVELDGGKAPLTVANFLKYVVAGHYDGTVFHRVVGGHMIQGGGYEKKGDQLVEKPTGAPIRCEAGNGLKNLEGTIAMARSDVPDTATAQFFINCRDNEMLDQSPLAAGFAVFGRVTEGLDVVKQINAVQTGVREVQGRLGSGQLRAVPIKGVPLSDVIIESVRVLTGPGEKPA